MAAVVHTAPSHRQAYKSCFIIKTVVLGEYCLKKVIALKAYLTFDGFLQGVKLTFYGLFAINLKFCGQIDPGRTVTAAHQTASPTSV